MSLLENIEEKRTEMLETAEKFGLVLKKLSPVVKSWII